MRDKRAIGLDDLAHCRKPAIFCSQQNEPAAEPVDAHAAEDGLERRDLLIRAEHWALHQPFQILRAIEQRLEPLKLASGFVDRLRLMRKLIEGQTIPSGNTRHCLLLMSHLSLLS